MGNNVIFTSEVDYMFEAWQLLLFLASTDNPKERYEEFKKGVLEKYGADSEHTKDCMAFSEKVILKAKKAFSGREAELKKYFAPIENDIIPANLLLSWSDWAGDSQVLIQNAEDMKSYYESFSSEMKDASFLKELASNMEIEEFDRIVGCKERGTSIDTAECMRNIFTYIQKLDLKAESKMRIQEVYLNRDEYIEPICRLYQEAADLLRMEEQEINNLCSDWTVYWGRLVEEDSFFETLKGIVELDEEILKKRLRIRPSIVMCTALYINMYGALIPCRSDYMTTCALGIALSEEFNWNSQAKENYFWDNMQPVFKALGDKSKADILLYIKDKPAYGAEIAKQFSLTTATVSHHMNKLLQLRIIHAEIHDGRVYYQVRKDELASMFEQCKKIFE